MQMSIDTPTAPVLSLVDISKIYRLGKGMFGKKVDIHALDKVSFDIFAGETVGIVGESGCGKSTLGRCIMKITHPTSGAVTFRGTNVLDDTSEANKAYWRQVRFVFQDPFSALNPRFTVFRVLAEPLIRNGVTDKQIIRQKVKKALQDVGLDPSLAGRYPHAFSGGQRQRIVIARALILDPELVIADEAVSALDVSVRAQVLNLLAQVRVQRNLTMMFISHDLGVVRHISDRVGVMYLGRLIELAETDDLYRQPRHPYTETLLSAVPNPDPRNRHGKSRRVPKGEVPDAAAPPSGCHFHPRCPYAVDKCKTHVPEFQTIGRRKVACHLAHELELEGVPCTT